MRQIILLCFILSLLGCATSRVLSPDENYTPKEESTDSIAILSLTKSGLKDIPFKLAYRGIDQENRSISGKISIYGKKDWEVDLDSNIIPKGKYEGKVFALKLPQGQYEFYDFIIEKGYQDARWRGGKEFSIPFVVSGGKAEYIGNYHIWSQDTDGWGISYEWFQSDERIRDIPIFKEKYPSIQHISYSTFNSNIESDLPFTPEDAEAHKNRSWYYLKKSEYDKALYHSSKAIELNDTLADAYVFRSLTYLFQGELTASFKDINSALQIDSNNVLGLVIRSIIYNASDKKQAANADLTKAKKTAPEYFEQLKPLLERFNQDD